jgi:hypothetical protein
MLTFLNARRSSFGILGVAAAMLFSAAPAFGQLTPVTALSPVDGTWRLVILADPSAKLLGCDDYKEDLTIDGWGFTGQEISRLGFNPASPTTGMNALGEITFTVSLSSLSYGSWTGSGSFTADNNNMSGKLTWVRDGVTYLYTFTGTRMIPGPAEY